MIAEGLWLDVASFRQCARKLEHAGGARWRPHTEPPPPTVLITSPSITGIRSLPSVSAPIRRKLKKRERAEQNSYSITSTNLLLARIDQYDLLADREITVRAELRIVAHQFFRHWLELEAGLFRQRPRRGS
jgi:hypothetical protein